MKIAPERIIDRIPVASRRYFATNKKQAYSTLQKFLHALRTPNDELPHVRFIVFPQLSTKASFKTLLKLANDLAGEFRGNAVVAAAATNRPSIAEEFYGVLEAARVLQNGFSQNHAESPQTRLATVLSILERQMTIASASIKKNQHTDQSSLTFHGDLKKLLDGLVMGLERKRELRILVVPQEHRQTATIVAKLVAAAQLLLPQQKPLYDAIKGIQSAVISFPDLDHGFEFSNLHLVVSNMDELPEWNPYDHLPYFLKLLRPAFDKDQELAVPQVLSQLSDLKFDHVFDIGCGTGAMLREISRRFGCTGIGIDPSPSRIEIANMNKQGANVQFQEGVFPAITTFSEVELAEQFGKVSSLISKLSDNYRSKCVLLLGNTLPHLGARTLKAWLHYLRQKNKLPKYIVFDFLCDWCASLYGAQGLVQLGPTHEDSKILKHTKAHMVSVLADSQIIRGVIFNWTDAHYHGPPVVDYCMVQQHSDTPETYIEILRSSGYSLQLPSYYNSGWGKHELHVATRSDELQARRFPEPAEGPNTRVNEAWYNYLSQLWAKAYSSTPNRGSCLESITLFPVAILPYQPEKVWARYIERTPKNKLEPRLATDQIEIESIWQWVTNPSKTRGGGAMSAAKSELLAPYAPGIFDAMLAEVPASILKHVLDTNPPFDLNSADLELSEIERRYFKEHLPNNASNHQYFAIPIYHLGMPLYCIIAAIPCGSFTPSLLHHLLETEKSGIEALVLNAWSDDNYRAFVYRALNILGDAKVTEDLPMIARKQGSWNSWLETYPGLTIMDSAHAKGRFEKFCAYHRSMVSELTKEPFIQISSRLRKREFFTSTSRGNEVACGHEFLCKKHKAAAAELVDDLRRQFGNTHVHTVQSALPPTIGSSVFNRAIEYLRFFENYTGSLPMRDDGNPPGSQHYTEANWKFQCFKALFCRAGENRGTEYRLSPLMIYAMSRFYLDDVDDSRFYINGQVVDRRFSAEHHAKPKIGIEDAWLKLINLWKRVIPQYVQRCEISATSNVGDEIGIHVTFTRPIQAQASGSSLHSLTESLDSLGQLEGKFPDQIHGFTVRFTSISGKVQTSWSYLSQASQPARPKKKSS